MKNGILILIALLLLNEVNIAQLVNGVPVSSSEKFNKRGIINNDDVRFEGKEMISDYDGNLMLQYSTYVDMYNDLSGNFTTTFNTNVSHRLFNERSDARQSYPINTSEWIFGYKGFAVQTMNFENHLYVKDPIIGEDEPLYEGQNVPLLIPGYHYCNTMFPLTSGQKDRISLLRADGSLLVLINSEAEQKTGLYIDSDFDNAGFGYVEYRPEAPRFRNLYYYPGDGLKYLFVEEETDYIQYENQTITDPGNEVLTTVFYLKTISNLYNSVELIYSNRFEDFAYGDPLRVNVFGRKFFVGLRNVSFTLPFLYDLELKYIIENGYIQNKGVNADAFYRYQVKNNSTDESNVFYTGEYSILHAVTMNASRDDRFIRRTYVERVVDKLGREDVIKYHIPNGSTAARKYIITDLSGTDSFISFNIKSFLIKDIYFKTGKNYKYDYYSQRINKGGSDANITDQYVNLTLDRNQAQIVNVKNVFRDSFTNFMLKSKKAINIFNERYKDKYVHEYTEFYVYTRDEDDETQPRQKPYINNIYTTITKSSLLEDADSYVTIKSYSMFNVNDYDYFDYSLKDVGSTIKLEKETIYSEALPSNRTVKVYAYDIDSLSGVSNNWYNGPFYITNIQELKYQNSLSEPKITIEHNYNYDYKIINFGDTPLKKYLLVGKTEIDPLGFKSRQDFLNIPFYETGPTITIPNTFNDQNYFLKFGLPIEEKQFSDTQTKIHKAYVYEINPNNLGDFGNVIEEINFPGTRESKILNTYFGFNGAPYDGLISSKVNDLGINWSFHYPWSIDGGILTTNLLTTSEQVISKQIAYSNGFSSKPFTTIVSDNDVIRYRSQTIYDKKGNLQFEADVNNFLTTFVYDPIGRLIGQALPGSYYNDAGSDFSSNYSSVIHYDDKIVQNPYQTPEEFDYDNINIISKSRFENFSDEVIRETDFGTIAAFVGDNSYDRISSTIDVAYYKGNITLQPGFKTTYNQKLQLGPNTNIPDVVDFSDNLLNYELRQEFDSFNRVRKEYVKGELKKTIEYDFLGNVKKETDGMGVSKTYVYDYLNRVTKIINTNGTYKKFDYILEIGTISGKSYYEKVITTDEEENKISGSGVKTITYYDKVGNKVAAEVGNGANNSITIFNYNNIYQLTSVVSPEGLTTSYTYDEFGNINSKTSPDDGTYLYKYDKFGRLRFELHTTQIPLQVTFHTYDNFNRLLSTGIKSVSSISEFDAFSIDMINSFETVETNLVLNNAYDKLPDEEIYSIIRRDPKIKQEYTNGKLAVSMYRDTLVDIWKYKLYSYDPRGNIKKEYVNE